MGHEQKLENLKQLIRSSVVLSVQEKEEWLGLADLMNDKQMSELMELLGHKTPEITKSPEAHESIIPTTIPKELVTADKALPSLSHISNLPSSVTGYVEETSKTSATNLSAAQKILAPVAHIEPITKTLVNSQIPSVVTQTPTPQKNMPIPESGLTSAISTKPSATLDGIDLSTPQETTALTVGHLRKFGVDALAQKLKELAIQHGYFTVLENIEQSSLYSAYISSGQRILAGQLVSSDKELSPQEFGMVADLMSSLRINRF